MLTVTSGSDVTLPFIKSVSLSADSVRDDDQLPWLADAYRSSSSAYRGCPAERIRRMAVQPYGPHKGAVCKTVSIGARWPLVFRMRSSARWRWQSTLAFAQQLVNLSSFSGVIIAAGVEFDGAAFVGQGLVVALCSTTSTSPTRASAWST